MRIRSEIKLLILVSLVLSNLAILPIQPHATRPPPTPSPTPKKSTTAQPVTITSRTSQAPLIRTIDLTNSSKQNPPTKQAQPDGLQRQAAVSSPSALTTASPAAPSGNMSSYSLVPSAGFDGIFDDAVSPPDVSVATGTTFVVETVNSELGVYTRQGTPVAITGLSQIFGCCPFLFDPKIIYDPTSHDYFVSIGDGDTNSVLIAVSLPDNPMSWKVYSLPANVPNIDQPIIGMSDDKFVVGLNDYSGPCPNSPCPSLFLGAETFVLSKAQMISGVMSLNETIFGPTKTLMSVDPVRSLSSTATLYLVSTGGSDLGNRDFHFFNMTGVPPGPVTLKPVPLSISTINPTILAPQPGTGVLVDSGDGPAPGAGDARVQSAVWFKGKLWFTFADGCNPVGDQPNQTRACFRLTEIDTNVSPNVVRQDFDVGLAGLYLFYPALAMDNTSNLGVVYGFSSATNSTCCYPSLAVTGQAISDLPGTFRHPAVIKVGSGVTAQGSGVSRYGDYFGASVDPSDPTRLWIAGEYVHFSGRWSTFIDSIRVKDYSISGVPSYITLAPGSSKNSTLNLNSLGGFAGNVSLTGTISPSVSNGPVPTFAPSTLSLVPSSTRTSTLTISTATATPIGFYNVTVKGTSGTEIQLVNATLRVGPDFTLTANATSVTMQGGTTSTAQVAITITSLNNLAGAVNLTGTVSPAGPTATLNPNSVPLTAGTTGTSSLTISITQSTLGGTYKVTVIGASNGVTHQLTLTVNIQDYTVATNPTSLFIIVGNNANSTINLTSLNGGFSIALTAASSPAGPTLTLNPSTITIASGASGTSTLTVSTSPSTALGNYTITVTATSGSHSHTTTVTVKVSGDFTVSANPTSLFLTNGQAGSSTITFTSIKGFSGTLSLSRSSYLPTNLSPTSITLTPGGSATATVTITGSQFGSFTITVAGTNGPLTHTSSVAVEVGGFVCLADPQSTTFTGCPSAAGWVFNGPVTHPATQLRIGVYASASDTLSGFDITLKTSSSVLRPVDADLTGSVLAGSGIFTKCIGGVAAVGSCSATDNADTLHFEVFNFNFQTGAPFTGLLFTAVYNITGTTSNVNIVFQTGCGSTGVDGGVCVTILSPYGQVVFEQVKTGSFANGNIQHITLSSNSSSISPVIALTSVATNITATSINGYPTLSDSGNVLFTASGSPKLTFSFNPNPLAFSQNQTTAVTTLTVTPSSAGNYTFTVSGTYSVTNATTNTSSTLVTSITLTIIVQDYSIVANPTSITLNRGSSATVALTITSLNGFQGTITLSSAVSPLVASDPTISLNLLSITLSRNQQLSATATIYTNSSTPTRLYNIFLRGSSGTILRSTTVRLNVNDFAITASPSTVSLTLAGTSTVSNVTLTSLNLSGSIALTVSISPSGPLVTLWPYTITLATGQSAISTLSISADAATPGTYTINVTATSGFLVHRVLMAVTVTGDFTVGASPSVLIIPEGSSNTTTITLSSQNSFSGTVYLGPFANIVINATAVSDPGCRGFGLTIDQPLPTQFQTSLPGSVIGTSCTGSFSFSRTYGLGSSLGLNYLEFGVNASLGHWHVKIYLNGVQLANADTDLNHHLHVGFQTGIVSGPLATSYSNTAVLSPGGSGSLVLTIFANNPTPLGNYTFIITPTSGGLAHTITIVARVVDFGITATPAVVTVFAGSSSTSSIAVSSLNGYSGTLNLSTSVNATGLTVSCSPSSITLAPQTTAMSTCTFSGSTSRNYLVTVTASNGPLTHSVMLTIKVVDFTITANPTTQTLKRGSATSFTITLRSLNGFSGTVSLNATVEASPAVCTPPTDPCLVPNQPTPSLSPTSIVLSSGGSSTSTLTISTINQTPTGNYTVVVMATSGSIQHTIQVMLIVTTH